MATTVAILGCNGRMGRQLISAGALDTEIQLVGGSVRQGSEFIGIDMGKIAAIEPLNIKATDQLNALANAELLIDFTAPQACIEHLAWCVENHKALLIGTTGFNEEQLTIISQASEQIPVLLAPNTSVGVNLVLKLLEITARAIGDYTDIEILEAHHRFKKDAPSGTALKMGQVIADALQRDLTQCAVYAREGDTGERKPESIGFATLRAGDIIGEHTALFADLGERIEITHKATSRQTFAMGAMRAAKWLAQQPAGLYSMQDVLNLSE